MKLASVTRARSDSDAGLLIIHPHSSVKDEEEGIEMVRIDCKVFEVDEESKED